MRFVTPIGFVLLIGLPLALLAAATDQARREKPQPLAVQEDDKLDITGYFTCTGKDAKGNPYTGIASILREGEVYFVRWVIETESWAGIGIRQGDDFAVSWAMQQENRVIRGVTFYRIEPGKGGPMLRGRWLTVPGDGTTREETLRWLKVK